MSYTAKACRTPSAQTSLAYAARVKLITNNAERMAESAEVARLKAVVAALRAGREVPLEPAAGEGEPDVGSEAGGEEGAEGGEDVSGTAGQHGGVEAEAGD
jgi:hypothetical protein